jgi:3-oxoacyl-[acyl-carrier protein] reductase
MPATNEGQAVDLRLKGKTALVTGASYGLGFACAQELAVEGVDVAICSRNQSEIESAAQRIASTTSGARAIGIAADLTKPEDIVRLSESASKELGKIDILVLSTGHPPTYPFSEATDQHWQSGYDMLVQPAIQLCRSLLPEMQRRRYGRVIFIGSIFGLEPEVSSVIQSTFRTGLNALAKCLATEYAAEGITVNVICPGYFDTPLVRNLAGQYAAAQKSDAQTVLLDWQNYSPVRKFGRPEDLGGLVAFLASPRGEFITGTAITMDGGAVRQY